MRVSCGLLSVVVPSVAVLIAIGPCTAQDNRLVVNGQEESPILTPVGQLAEIVVLGTPGEPFAMMLSGGSAAIPTPYGLLGLDPFRPDAVLLLDGFDASHPLYTIAYLGLSGYFLGWAVPFDDPNLPFGLERHLQVLVADPAAPGGYDLTNPVTIENAMPPPVLSLATPRIASPNGLVTLSGAFFMSDPALNVVELDGHACGVVASTSQELQVLVPEGARSGAFSVTTPFGTAPPNPDNVNTWCAVIDGISIESAQPEGWAFRLGVVGQIAVPGERDTYVVNALAGEEVFAEVYSWDFFNDAITGPINASNPYLDPEVRITIQPTLALASDNDSGPSLNAGIGISSGTSFFVADETRAYNVEVATNQAAGYGYYLLVMGTRSPGPMPVQIQAIYPNLTQVGTVIQVFGTGIDPSNPAGHAILIGGVPAIPHAVLPGRLDVLVPPGTISGAVQMVTPSGTTNHPADRMASWLSIVSGSAVLAASNGTIPINVGDSAIGTLTNPIIGTAAKDTFLFAGVAGTAYRIEVTALHDVYEYAVTSTFLGVNPVDPEIRIFSTSGSPTYLAFDANGGPGFNAILGLAGGPAAFVPPTTGTYRIEVTSWFGISQGRYVLNLVAL